MAIYATKLGTNILTTSHVFVLTAGLTGCSEGMGDAKANSLPREANHFQSPLGVPLLGGVFRGSRDKRRCSEPVGHEPGKLVLVLSGFDRICVEVFQEGKWTTLTHLVKLLCRDRF